MQKMLKALILILLIQSNIYSQQWGLYTLYSPMNSTKAYLIDTMDSPATYKTWTFPASDKTGYSSYLLKGDTLLRSVARTGNQLSGGGMTGTVQKVLWDGTVAWSYTYSSSTYCLHHDICPMPNGNVLMISYDVKSAAEATQAGSSQNITIWSEKIIEVKPTGPTTGTIVWEWKLWDHLCQNVNSAKDNYVTSIVQNPHKMNINYKTGKDWIHMNGIDYNVDLDQIIVSSHNMNEIYVIDHSTTTAEAAGSTGGNSGKGGDFLYRWGNPAAYGASGTAILNVAHDAHWVPGDCPKAGYIAVFNNKGGTSGKACVDMLNPPYNGYNYSISLGSAFQPTSYDYRYNSAYSSTNMGNSQQLPNGNTHICVPSTTTAYIFEINPAGTTLWSKTISGSLAQSFRYSKCHVRGPVAKATVSATEICEGTQISLNSLAVSPTESNPTYNYNWTSTPAGYLSTSANDIATPLYTTTYTLVITNTLLGCSDSTQLTVKVNPVPPLPIISLSSYELTSDAAYGNQWYYEGTEIPGATNQTYLPTQNGNYQVAVTNQYGCTSPLSAPFYFTATSDNRIEMQEIIIYPNPSTGIIYTKGILTEDEIIISDMSGREIISFTGSEKIDLSTLSNGIYYLRILLPDFKQINKKIILNKY